MRTRRVLCASVLVAEAFVVFFALLVAANLSDLPRGTVLAVGFAAVLGCLLLIGLLRYRWAYALGSVLQVLLVLSGFVVPLMFFLGVVFAGLWFLSLYLALQVQRSTRGRR